jgi:hypothetical protein
MRRSTVPSLPLHLVFPGFWYHLVFGIILYHIRMHYETNSDIANNDLVSNDYKTNFHAIGFFNEADTLESSSILIYSDLQTCLFMHWS